MKRFISLFFLAALIFLPRGAQAENYDLKQITPAVQQAIQSRQARFSQLQHLKQQGVIGEDNQGMVKVLKDLPEVKNIAAGENQDREIIYQTIAEQNGLGPVGIAKVREIFAEVQRGKAKPGESIQLRSGEWVQK